MLLSSSVDGCAHLDADKFRERDASFFLTCMKAAHLPSLHFIASLKKKKFFSKVQTKPHEV